MSEMLRGFVQGKIWGTTQCVFRSEATEVHLINAKKGYRCSEHFHKVKVNLFFVVSGQLRVTIFRENDLKDETILGPGMATEVGPDLWHQFEVLKDTMALEIYYTKLDMSDIVRRTQGGKICDSNSSTTNRKSRSSTRKGTRHS